MDIEHGDSGEEDAKKGGRWTLFSWSHKKDPVTLFKTALERELEILEDYVPSHNYVHLTGTLNDFDHGNSKKSYNPHFWVQVEGMCDAVIGVSSLSLQNCQERYMGSQTSSYRFDITNIRVDALFTSGLRSFSLRSSSGIVTRDSRTALERVKPR